MYTADDTDVARWLDSICPIEKGKWIHDALIESDEFGPMYEELETVIEAEAMTSWLSAEPNGLKVIYDYCRPAASKAISEEAA